MEFTAIYGLPDADPTVLYAGLGAPTPYGPAEGAAGAEGLNGEALSGPLSGQLSGSLLRTGARDGGGAGGPAVSAGPAASAGPGLRGLGPGASGVADTLPAPGGAVHLSPDGPRYLDGALQIGKLLSELPGPRPADFAAPPRRPRRDRAPALRLSLTQRTSEVLRRLSRDARDLEEQQGRVTRDLAAAREARAPKRPRRLSASMAPEPEGAGPTPLGRIAELARRGAGPRVAPGGVPDGEVAVHAAGGKVCYCLGLRGAALVGVVCPAGSGEREGPQRPGGTPAASPAPAECFLANLFGMAATTRLLEEAVRRAGVGAVVRAAGSESVQGGVQSGAQGGSPPAASAAPDLAPACVSLAALRYGAADLCRGAFFEGAFARVGVLLEAGPREAAEAVYAALGGVLSLLARVEAEERLPLDSLYVQLARPPPGACALLQYVDGLVGGAPAGPAAPGPALRWPGAEEPRGGGPGGPEAGGATPAPGGPGCDLLRALGYTALEVLSPAGRRRVYRLSES